MLSKKLLKKYHDMACHNLFCYSENCGMTIPKEGYEDEWLATKAEIEELENEIKEGY